MSEMEFNIQFSFDRLKIECWKWNSIFNSHFAIRMLNLAENDEFNYQSC